MKTKRLYTWQFFVGAFIGGFTCFIIGVVLATFLYMKNIDIYNVRKRQEYLIREVKELTKERQQINYIFKERGLIKDHNEKAVIKPKEEGK
ncbi:MAG: hypothetical protein E3J87_11060 [Candidatus Cloacimonadota bacterium]|nr:MAG: hypothetical protein E3J87_11060 [Candidatus Cloacimonadota bacterium]